MRVCQYTKTLKNVQIPGMHLFHASKGVVNKVAGRTESHCTSTTQLFMICTMYQSENHGRRSSYPALTTCVWRGFVNCGMLMLSFVFFLWWALSSHPCVVCALFLYCSALWEVMSAVMEVLRDGQTCVIRSALQGLAWGSEITVLDSIFS